MRSFTLSSCTVAWTIFQTCSMSYLAISDQALRAILRETISLALKKDKIKCTDYRKTLLLVTLHICKYPDVPQDVLELLLSFCEMMGIFYANEDKRCPKQVLRLYNLSFRHSIAVKSVLFPVTAMTPINLQGLYYHQIIDHAAFIYRLICIRSINAETFERFFDRIHHKKDLEQATHWIGFQCIFTHPSRRRCWCCQCLTGKTRTRNIKTCEVSTWHNKYYHKFRYHQQALKTLAGTLNKDPRFLERRELGAVARWWGCWVLWRQ